jgi:hypothetical protein
VEINLKTLYNGLNILFLDMDSGMSEVSILNRLQFDHCVGAGGDEDGRAYRENIGYG